MERDPVIPKRNHRHRPLQLLSRKFASMHTAAPNSTKNIKNDNDRYLTQNQRNFYDKFNEKLRYFGADE